MGNVMINVLKTLHFQLLLCFCIFSQLSSQTRQWRVVWDKNTENNISYYRVFRDTIALPEAEVGQVGSLDTVFTDDDIDVGVLYYYRATAVVSKDSVLYESDFSNVGSAAIPEITLPEALKTIILPRNSNVNLPVKDYIHDQDDAFDSLLISITDTTKLSLEFDILTNVITITSPADWNGSESIYLTVTDPRGFYDIDTISIYSDSSMIPIVNDTIPDSLSAISVFPIPYYAVRHSNIEGITFKNLPQGASLIIYNLLGAVLFKHEELMTDYIWNMKNNSGREIASGIYIYLLLNRSDKKIASGKLIIIR